MGLSASWLSQIVDALLQRITVVGGRMRRIGTNMVIEIDDTTVGKRRMFPVKPTQVGGSAGNKTTQVSFTYDVTDLNGATLGLAMTPQKNRTSLGAHVAPTAGDFGVGFYDADGSFKLWDANEAFDTGPC